MKRSIPTEEIYRHGSDATSVSNSPKTGDNTNIAIFVLALAVSAGYLGTVVTVKKKHK